MSRRRIRRVQPTTDRRPPVERLAALVAEPNVERSHRILWRLRRDLDEHPDPGPWIAAARTLCDRGLFSEDAVIYFAELFTEGVVAAAATSDAELVRIRDTMDDIERAHGLGEDETWLIEEAPPEWRTLNEAWDLRADALVVTALRASGFDELAEMRASRCDEWDERENLGREELWGRLREEEEEEE